MKGKKQRYLSKSVTFLIYFAKGCSVIFMIFAIIGVVLSLKYKDATGLIITVPCLFFSSVLRGVANFMKRLRKYGPLIVVQHITSIDELAKLTSYKYDMVCKDLTLFIKNNWINDVVLDLPHRQVIIKGMSPQKTNETYEKTDKAHNEEKKKRMVQCSGCGASYILTEDQDNKVCDYCGRLLEG